MAIDLQVKVIDREGDQADQRKLEYMRRDYETRTQHSRFHVPAGAKTAVPMGAVTLCRFVAIFPETAMRVYKEAETTYWDANKAFVVEGCEVTLLYLYADVAGDASILLAGDA